MKGAQRAPSFFQGPRPPPLLGNFSGCIISSPRRAEAPASRRLHPTQVSVWGQSLFLKGSIPPPHIPSPSLGGPGTGLVRPGQLCRLG